MKKLLVQRLFSTNPSKPKQGQTLQTLICKYCFATGIDLKKQLYFKRTKKKDPLKIFSKKMTDNLLLLPNDYKYVILASETGVQRLSKSCFEIRWETPLIESCFQ